MKAFLIALTVLSAHPALAAFEQVRMHADLIANGKVRSSPSILILVGDRGRITEGSSNGDRTSLDVLPKKTANGDYDVQVGLVMVRRGRLLSRTAHVVMHPGRAVDLPLGDSGSSRNLSLKLVAEKI